jgi:hypothetical protein
VKVLAVCLGETPTHSIGCTVSKEFVGCSRSIVLSPTVRECSSTYTPTQFPRSTPLCKPHLSLGPTLYTGSDKHAGGITFSLDKVIYRSALSQRASQRGEISRMQRTRTRPKNLATNEVRTRT